MGTGLEIALIAGTATTTAASIYQQEKAASAQKRQYRAEQRKAEIENVYKVRQQIRQARLAQSAMVNQAALSGGMGGSGLAGGLSSVGSQLAGNLSYMSDIAKENTAIGGAAIDAASAQSKAAVYGQVGQLAGTIFSPYAGKKPTSNTGVPFDLGNPGV